MRGWFVLFFVYLLFPCQLYSGGGTTNSDPNTVKIRKREYIGIRIANRSLNTINQRLSKISTRDSTLYSERVLKEIKPYNRFPDTEDTTSSHYFRKFDYSIYIELGRILKDFKRYSGGWKTGKTLDFSEYDPAIESDKKSDLQSLSEELQIIKELVKK
ncbi:hypothetical protein [Reichenbachiella versicolor]|uniref:hypothetical protein n=1 Tax=Reichenbachiella versicolor TaxID=1821036 RepID=UPI000D6DF0AE|nr:hypothetical protein [Reichenbachiella versicolor]